MDDNKNVNAEIYARMGLLQIPRILSLQDRNPLSKTYGSFSRTWWLDRTTDFSNALTQYATHALALAWACPMPGSRYYRHPKVLQWIFAGMEHWISTQHDDGSFDEFYPHEHGWAGPTGFLVYAMADSYLRTKDEIPADLSARLLEAIRKGGEFLGAYDEIGTLANHYVMAALGIRFAHHVTGDDSLLKGYQTVLSDTLALFDDEGWGLEYDGADIGYLSASVSFFAKIDQIAPDEKISKVIEKAVEFSSYFCYPDGHFAGTLGSRNTLHFYPHGYELLANQNPLAARMADAMIEGLEAGALVPPHIMADRYFLYRIPEFFLSYIDSDKRQPYQAKLPYEKEDFETWFPKGRFYISKKGDYYCVANAGKGGVVKVFDIPQNKMIHADSGIMVQTGKRIAGSQWVDPKYRTETIENGVEISGPLHRIPGKIFTPFKFVLFRIFLMTIAWNTKIAYRLKGWIRKLLMLKHKPSSHGFTRSITFDGGSLVVRDTLFARMGKNIKSAFFGDDIPVRYVPQSRYFQPQDLNAKGCWATNMQLRELRKGELKHQRTIDLQTGKEKIQAWGTDGEIFE